MSFNIFQNEYHVVRVELKGPKSKEQLRAFDRALKQLVESHGGTVRFLSIERDQPKGKGLKRARRGTAKRRKR